MRSRVNYRRHIVLTLAGLTLALVLESFTDLYQMLRGRRLSVNRP